MNIGAANISWLIGSGVGVNIAAKIKIIIIECLRYLDNILGVIKPNFDNMKDNIGSSNIAPVATNIIETNPKYSFMSMLLAISSEPKFAANFSIEGISTKYEKTTPEKKQRVVKKVAVDIHFFSFSYSAGDKNFHS